MDFYRYRTTYESARRLMPDRSLTLEQFYAEMLAGLTMAVASQGTPDILYDYNHALAERDLWRAGFPYYKTWPRMIDEFATIDLDIPSNCLKSPYESFCVFMPKEPIIDFMHNDRRYWLRSMLVRYLDEAYIVERSATVSAHTLLVWYDIGETTDILTDFPVYSLRIVKLFNSPTIEEAVAHNGRLMDSGKIGVPVPDAVSQAVARLAIATCFLATGASKVIERDILREHLDAYRRLPPDSPDRTRLEQKSAKRGLGGFHIGRGRSDRALSLQRGVSYAEAMREDGSGRHLIYQHRRGAHWIRIKGGPGKKDILRVDLRDETTVRRDLPPRPRPIETAERLEAPA